METLVISYHTFLSFKHISFSLDFYKQLLVSFGPFLVFLEKQNFCCGQFRMFYDVENVLNNTVFLPDFGLMFAFDLE